MANPSDLLLSRLLPQIQFKGNSVDYVLCDSPKDLLNLAENNTDAKTRRAGSESWCGLGSQSIREFFSDGYSTEALSQFSESLAQVQAQKALGGRLTPSVAGGAWVIPLVLQSHPMASRIRPREKLVPLNIRLRIGAMAMTSSGDITTNGAKVARALWDYALAGGIVSLTSIHVHGYYKQSNRGTYGCLIETRIPLSSESDIALACTTPLYRAAAIPLMQALSPVDHDSLRGWYEPEPGILTLRGLPDDIAQMALYNIKVD